MQKLQQELHAAILRSRNRSELFAVLSEVEYLDHLNQSTALHKWAKGQADDSVLPQCLRVTCVDDWPSRSVSTALWAAGSTGDVEVIASIDLAKIPVRDWSVRDIANAVWGAAKVDATHATEFWLHACTVLHGRRFDDSRHLAMIAWSGGKLNEQLPAWLVLACTRLVGKMTPQDMSMVMWACSTSQTPAEQLFAECCVKIIMTDGKGLTSQGIANVAWALSVGYRKRSRRALQVLCSRISWDRLSPEQISAVVLAFSKEGVSVPHDAIAMSDLSSWGTRELLNVVWGLSRYSSDLDNLIRRVCLELHAPHRASTMTNEDIYALTRAMAVAYYGLSDSFI